VRIKKMELDEIVSIEEVGEVETIDIEVDGNHLFVANGILTHNSGYGAHTVEMDNIADSMAIAHTADLIISLTQNEELKENSQLKFDVIKSRISRNGVGGLVDVDYERMKLLGSEDVENSLMSNIIKQGTEDIEKNSNKLKYNDDIT
jgi:hypothetical protein